jgi:protein SCO1/2
MNTFPSLLRPRVLAAIVSMLLAAAALSGTPAAPSCCSKPVPAELPLSDKSLYNTESKWTTDAGKKIRLADLRGRPQVILMFFASCQSACPMLVQELQKIEAALKPKTRAQVGFTLVTFDPRRDTPEALAAYLKIRHLPADRWRFLHGEPDDIQELAVLLGVKYKEEAGGQFSHSNLITVLNESGEIVHQLAGLGQDIKGTVEALEALVPET